MDRTHELGSADLLADVLGHLSKTVDTRAASGDTTHSYTAKLLAGGGLKCAKKLIEEGGEFALAVAVEDEDAVANEAADVLYHLAVCLRARGISLDKVAQALIGRQGISGLEEKARRTAG